MTLNMMMLSMVGLAVLSFIQNMAFTWSSRSRNSGDPSYHRRASWASNGVWFITNGLMFSILTPIMKGDVGIFWYVAAGVVYVVSTSEGSVYMMRRLLRTETGKRKVGS